MSWLCARIWIGCFVPIVVAVVRARFQDLAEALPAGYVALVCGLHCVCIVHEGAAQGIVLWPIGEVSAHGILDLDPDIAAVAEQAIGKIIQAQRISHLPGDWQENSRLELPVGHWAPHHLR